MNKEIVYIEKQLDKAQRSLKNVPKNAPEKQTWDLMEKILTLESILEMLKYGNDAVPVVRCKNCKRHCTVRPDYYCADGVRKDDDNG